MRIEHCGNGRTHVWLGKIKILSFGPRHVKPFKNPKLGVSYSVWDGEELLEQSIKQIRATADYINVVWQKLSWYGKPCNPGLEKFLLKLKQRGLIDELIFFEPDLDANPGYNELNKRNVGLCAARRAGCTHFMTMDTDEFYDPTQFRAAYDDIIKRNLTHTCCNIVSYITPTVRFVDCETYFVPFIHTINNGEVLASGAFYGGIPCLVDPTRRIKLRKNSRFCFLGTIIMHHMHYVRKDVHSKLMNSTTSQTVAGAERIKKKFLDETKDIPAKLKTGIYVKVNNKFKIKI